MIRQDLVFSPAGALARVTFELPPGIWAESIHLVGDFNGWDAESHPFRRTHEGSWSIAVDLPDVKPYRFRYLVDGEHWLTDGQARPASGGGASNSAFIVQPVSPPAARTANARPERMARLDRRRPVAQPAIAEQLG
jgi:1,4-alpha-glucan branching enzyme